GGYLDANSLYHGLLATPSEDDTATLHSVDSGIRNHSPSSADAMNSNGSLAHALSTERMAFLEAGIGSAKNPLDGIETPASAHPVLNSSGGPSEFASTGNGASFPAITHDLRAHDMLFSTAFQSGLELTSADSDSVL